MIARLPLVAIALSVAGVIPFIVCGIGALQADSYGGQTWLLALLAYGAVILSFVGAVHWGLALTTPAHPAATEDGPLPPIAAPAWPAIPGSRTQAIRFGLSVLPALIGWLAALTPMFLIGWVGLLLLIAGFVGVAAAETRGAALGLLPQSYLWLRYAVSAVVIAMLVTVLTLRLLGATITT